MISKQLFVKYINCIQEKDNMANEINKILIKYNQRDLLDGYDLINNDFIDIIVELLDKNFDDNCDWVDYFIYELDYGNKYWTDDGRFCSDLILDENDQPIDISTPEKLYDFLIEEYKD